MGTDYALGIVKEFTATTKESLEPDEWKGLLNDRLDIEQYVVNFKDKSVSGSLKNVIFKDNIEDFYQKLVVITDNEHILNWLNDKGTDVNQYDTWRTDMKFDQQYVPITISVELALLFVEGKVLVEEFNTEPKLMNWLFRHVDSSNKLTGCVMSDIVG